MSTLQYVGRARGQFCNLATWHIGYLTVRLCDNFAFIWWCGL